MMNRTLLGLAIAAALPVAAQAHDTTAAAPADQQIVVRDAETGQLRAATAEEAASLSTLRSTASLTGSRSTLRAAPLSPQVKTHASGAVGIRMTDEMASYSIVTRGADGKLVEQCLPSKEEAEAALKNGAAAAKTNLPTE